MKKLLRVLGGEVVTPPPVWLMRQAGRYLPEYRALREQAGSFLNLCFNPELAAAVTLQPVTRFGMDAAILFSDILVVPYALGQPLDYREGEGPVLEPVTDERGLATLSLDALQERLAPIYQTVRIVAATQPQNCTLIGFAGGPWTVAAYMMEGQSGKKGGGDFETARRLAYARPAFVQRLIDLVTEATISYLGAQIGAGAEVVQLFDSWAGLLSPEQFRSYVIKPTQRITATLKARFPFIRIIGFPRGAGLSYPAYSSMAGIDAMGLDTTVPLTAAVKPGLFAPMPLQGNLDPLLLLEGGLLLDEAIIHAKRLMHGHSYIFNLGHGVSQHTNPDHVARLVERVKSD
jgi:uroporphyrinogen decarboxylase